jgi:hypothetical protein
LFERLGSELERLIGPTPAANPDALDVFVQRLRELPRGLRAMAATYELDVSISLDDLGWHFANWHHEQLALETAQGLRELGAAEAADLFESALFIAKSDWSFFDAPDFPCRYSESSLARDLDTLNQRMWALHGSEPGATSLLDLWPRYARLHPEHVCVG